jgi:hypothetical protein
MDENQAKRFFLEPKLTFHRQYEALRAVFVEAQPLSQVAEKFGYKASALRSMVSRLRADCRHGTTPPFFSRTDAGVLAGEPSVRTDITRKRPRSRTVGS